MNDLQAFLINKRKELKLSLRNASKLIGISHSYLSTLEKGIDPRNNAPIKPTPETLQLISNAYNTSYEYLMKMAGYLNYTSDNGKLTKKDEKEIEKILDETKEKLGNAEGLMLNGELATPEAIQSILDAMKVGMEIAKQRNKKYTPNKYKKNK
ncbi:helix-turn-helix transcriptional regulator [Clostridium botulinum]|uniref:helix-turn-helix domain-containing protein n=1 Tax=Clostridium botulinum TaxID=1491 RepID=UPI000D0CFEBF|nr:helix-turn-helix transcriptional regulator [Clostridium botulinum]MCJ8173177.1 helix-turn-helix transcriptional regulator [Clostridium botulinum]NFM46584.1 helix-turn-helix transcriptional regulator [Clostridium botulinum]PSM00409.1 XRE family transcriptional regulator [Clostridium botulinum]HDK7138886.1 helix-turn-helix transcriptional regulator [Clostridium botulinum]HDK7142215.1 helix-turn-helix transcriptional regulator [Clostridium botulinum]